MIFTKPSVSPDVRARPFGAEREFANLVVDLLVLAPAPRSCRSTPPRDGSTSRWECCRSPSHGWKCLPAITSARTASLRVRPCAPASAGRRRPRSRRYPLALVSILSLILMKPRSVSCDADFLETDLLDVCAARPAATEARRSTLSSFFSPPCASTVIVTESFADLGVRDLRPGDDADAALLERALDLFRRIRHPRAEGCVERHRVDQRVTAVPNALKTSANSHPTAPAPTMMIALGAFSRMSASSDEMMVDLFSSSPACEGPLHAGTGREHDGFLRILRLVLAVGRLHGDGVLAGELCGAFDVRDLVLLEEKFDSLGVLQRLTARERFIAGL